MTDAGRREQLAREVSCHINNRTRLRESLVPQRDNWDPQAEEWKESWRDVADYILQREAALLKVAEAAKVYWPMAEAALFDRPSGYLGQEYYAALKALIDALDASQKGRTP